MSRRYRPWTSDDDATLKRMIRAGYSREATAQHMDRAKPLICRKCRDLGLEGIGLMAIAMLARVNLRRRMAA